jgi:hypothetical protein
MSDEPTHSPGKATRKTGRDLVLLAERFRDAFGLVLLLLVLTFVLTSLMDFSGWSAVVISSVGGASGVIGIASADAGVGAVRWAAALGLVSVGLSIAAELADEPKLLAPSVLVQAVILVWAAGAVLRDVIHESDVTFRTILGAVSVYLILGMLFALVYVAIDRLQSGDFFGHPPQTGDYIFFSYTTLSTTGFGDLVPQGQPGRMIAGLEMLTGQIFVVTLVAALVSLWRPRGRREVSK